MIFRGDISGLSYCDETLEIAEGVTIASQNFCKGQRIYRSTRYATHSRTGDDIRQGIDQTKLTQQQRGRLAISAATATATPTRRIEGNPQTTKTRPHTLLGQHQPTTKDAQSLHPSHRQRAQRPGAQDQAHRQQHLTTATDNQQQPPTNKRTGTALAVL
jgi:hypothetical protein